MQILYTPNVNPTPSGFQCEACGNVGIEPSKKAIFPYIICEPCIKKDEVEHNAKYGCSAEGHNC